MGYRTVFNIVGVVLVAWFICATQALCANHGDAPANNDKVISESVKAGLLYLADTSRSARQNDPSAWSVALRKSLFPNVSSSEYIATGMNTMAFIPDFEASPYNQDGSLLMPDRDRDRLENRARGEAYRVTGDLLLAFEPIAKLKKKIEPFMRPVEVYKGDDGSVSTKYFGSGEAHKENSVKVFSMSLGVSPSHNINVGMNFYKTVELSFFSGDRMELSYAPSSSNHKVGIRERGLDQVLLVYGFVF